MAVAESNRSVSGSSRRKIALEAKLAEVRELRAEVCSAHVQIAARTLEPMQARYRVVAEDQQRDLTRAKADRRKQGPVV